MDTSLPYTWVEYRVTRQLTAAARAGRPCWRAARLKATLPETFVAGSGWEQRSPGWEQRAGMLGLISAAGARRPFLVGAGMATVKGIGADLLVQSYVERRPEVSAGRG